MSELDANKFFWVENKQVEAEVEAALQECPPWSMHPRVVQSFDQTSFDFLKALSFLELRKVLIDFKDTHDLDTYFDVEDLDKVDNATWDQMMLLRSAYTAFGGRCVQMAKMSDILVRKISMYAEAYRMAFVYRPMVYNSDFFDPLHYKAMVLKLLWCMEKGYLFALLLFCELCPDFVTRECYPKFTVHPNTFDMKSKINPDSDYNKTVFQINFYFKLLLKHTHKVLAVLKRSW